MGNQALMEIIFQDESLLVVNKPAGISTLPDGYNPTLPHIKSLLEGQMGRLWIVHRLDKDTSGVLLLACTAQAHRSLNTQFEQHRVSKEYHAIINGDPDWQEKTVDLPLRSNGDRHHRTVVDPVSGKLALTRFTILERFTDYCLIEAIPATGRTHQIRAHLSALNLSIVGDQSYSRKGDGSTKSTVLEPELASRMMLHAISLEITHPTSGVRMTFFAPYPADFSAVLQYLR